MALGIDIYRYQTVTDWNAVRRHGVSFVYVKATDGGGPAIVRADGQVRGAQTVGLPVGLYHYAQLAPSPEVQADVLTAEVHRLAAYGLPPALDLEDPFRPNRAARDFAYRFLTRLRANGFGAVTLYANTGMLGGIEAESLDVPGMIMWEANYGPNTGRRHDLPPKPWSRQVHQYTSVGEIPGIRGRVDLNEALTFLPPAMPVFTESEDDDVSYAVTAPAGENEHVVVPCNGKPNIYIGTAFGENVEVLEMFAIGDTPGPSGAAVNTVETGTTWHADRPGGRGLPPGTRCVSIRYNAGHAFTAWCA